MHFAFDLDIIKTISADYGKELVDFSNQSHNTIEAK
jgi:hypothetical protein